MFRHSSVLLVMIVLFEGNCNSLGISLMNVARSRAEKVYPARPVERVRVLSPSTEASNEGSNPGKESGENVDEKNGKEMFYGGTELVLGPEGDVKPAVIVENKGPYHHLASLVKKPMFFKKIGFQMFLFFLSKMVFIFSIKIIGVFLLVTKATSVGFFALITTLAIFGLRAC